LPVELKIENKTDTLRKLILRKAALNAGLPTKIAEKPKKAVQYSTGINNAMKKIAKNHEKSVNEYVNDLFQLSKSSA
jgi:asparagine synthetase B (glutamine-hydrolysing)